MRPLCYQSLALVALLITLGAQLPHAAVTEYLAVRYADNPLRWQRTTPAAFDPNALSSRPPSQNLMKNGCLQFDSPPKFPFDTPLEDCFFLNLWLPENRTVTNISCNPAAGGCNLPVLFWIYGGGFLNGAAKYPVVVSDGSPPITPNLYNGSDFASQGRCMD